MGLVTSLTAWTEETFGRYGAPGLFALAFAEASFFPIPPDLLLIALGLANPELALYYGIVATAGSVLGGAAGYGIGYYAGHPLLERYAGNRSVQRAEAYYARWGAWAVVVSAVTPVPYKVFTILSGILELRFRAFMVASVAGRGARLMAEAVALFLWGDELLPLLDRIWWGVLLATVAGLAAWYAWRRARNAVDAPS